MLVREMFYDFILSSSFLKFTVFNFENAERWNLYLRYCFSFLVFFYICVFFVDQTKRFLESDKKVRLVWLFSSKSDQTQTSVWSDTCLTFIRQDTSPSFATTSNSNWSLSLGGALVSLTFFIFFDIFRLFLKKFQFLSILQVFFVIYKFF